MFTSELKKLREYLESQPQLLLGGQMRVELTIKELSEIIEYITFLNHFLEINPLYQTEDLQQFILMTKRRMIELNIFIAECQAEINSMILNDKLDSYLLYLPIRLIELLKMLEADLISNEKDFLNFWTNASMEEWKKLWLPVKTDSVALDSISSPSFLKNTMSNSWFSTIAINPQNKNWKKTCSPFFKFLCADGMVKDDTKLKVVEEKDKMMMNNNNFKIRKLKLKLKSDQKKLLHAWNDHARFSYNKAVEMINSGEKVNNFELRNKIVQEAVQTDETKFVLSTPKDIRAAAVFEACKNFKVAFTNLKKKNIKKFNVNFKSRKVQERNGWTIEIPKTAFIFKNDNNTVKKSMYIYKRITKNILFETRENFSSLLNAENKFDHDCKIQFDGLDYYLIVPFQSNKMKNDKVKSTICSMDPGVRTFQTLYDPENECILKIGDEASTVIYKLLLKLDKLLSLQSIKQTKKLELKIKRVRRRIQNLQKDLHDKTAFFLCSTYKNVVIPPFDGKGMSNKITRKISSTTVRKMMVLGHSKFLERLRTKASEFGTNIILTDESYTTKTCGRCNMINNNVGSSKTFHCYSCKFETDRDANGAFNILRKGLGVFNAPNG